MDFSVATVTLQSLSPYSQSRQHSAPKWEKEDADAYDKRTAIEKAHFNEQGVMVIPATSMHQAIAAAAGYSKTKIRGQGQATYAQKFKSGITIVKDIEVGVPRSEFEKQNSSLFIDVMCDTKGGKGSSVSKRVSRRFPVIPSWEATFDVWILDPIVTEDVLRETIQAAGLFIGIGRWRPVMNGGSNGRFTLLDLAWADNRRLAA